MLNRIRPRHLACATSAVVLAVLSHGVLSQRVSFDGIQYFGINPVVHQFKSGSMTIHWQGRATMASKNPTSIFNNLLLDCAGVIDVRKEGEWKAEGYCDHTDRDGDTWVGHWWADQTMPATRWELIHGTGKYTGATGNGTAKYTELKPGANGLAISEVTGYVELKK